MTYAVENLARFPAKPGVYIMKNSRGKVLYVGKAKNLKARVKQYFSKHRDQRSSIPFLVAQVASIDTIVVSSEKEALILENNLIKQYKPKYNVLLKDDKSYIAVAINHKAEWPMVQIVRYRGRPKPGSLYFGPYTSAGAARQTVDLTNRLFPLRQCSDQEFARRTRPCILYGMKRCLAPCVGYCTKEEYGRYLTRTIQFLKGQDKEVLKALRLEMEAQSKALEFEKAGETLKMIRQIEKTVEAQHVDRILRADSDVLGLYRQGDEVAVSKLLFRGGKLMGADNFLFSSVAQEDDAVLESFIMQHYHPGSDFPEELLVTVPLANSGVLSEQLEELAKRKVKISKPQRGEKVRLLQMALENARAAFEKEKNVKVINERILQEMQEQFHLTSYPRRIECFDNSNLGGDEPVAAMVVFVDGVKESKSYRTFKVKTADPGDDYGAMYEVLSRRYQRGKEESDLPDLLIVDGGKGQLNIARKVLQELDIINVNLIAITKEEGRHDRGQTAERVFLPGVKDPVHFRRNSPLLFFLQRVRDEAHRVALTFQKKRRSKKALVSGLDAIPGIGPAKKRALLRALGSVRGVKEATAEELEKVKGISRKDAQAIISHFAS